jgi:three-Cys-motif partner protein
MGYGGNVTQQRLFGGDWTEEKLRRIEKYLSAYTTALSQQRFRTAYIDAFAGTGYRQLKQEQRPLELMFPEFTEQDAQAFLQGSAQKALQAEPRFDKYIFIEQEESRFNELQKLKDKFPEVAEDIILVNADCNAYLQDLCWNRNWRSNRAVLFLDPFGMQVEWKTIEAIAHTQAIDLWLLFPLGVAVNRLLRRDGQIDETLRKKLDTLFGTTDWFDAFYESETIQTLFGEEARLRKVVGLEQIGQYFVARLKTVFAGVAEKPLPLYNSRNIPLYLLCFAAGNPSGAALAVKIAQDILGK